jgi:MFS family permease
VANIRLVQLRHRVRIRPPHNLIHRTSGALITDTSFHTLDGDGPKTTPAHSSVMSSQNGFLRTARWLANEFGLATMRNAGKDVYILILARYVRLFAYGAVALILALYFQELGFSDEQIGLFMTLTLLGDVLISLLLTLVADSIGRRTILLLGAISMAASGAIFATTGNYIALLMAAIIGVISPSGNEIGPFRAVEESTLAHLVPEAKRSDVYTWYVVLAVLGTSTGLAVGGQAVDFFQAKGWTDLDTYRAIFWIYTGVGCIMALMTLALSRHCEHADHKSNQPTQNDETEPLLNGDGVLESGSTSPQAPKPPKKLWISISTISKPSRKVLFKLCSLFFFDSLGSGMVPFSLINYYMQKKFNLPQSKLGGIMSATWYVSLIDGYIHSLTSEKGSSRPLATSSLHLSPNALD